MSKFKVGDRVKIVGRSSPFAKQNFGKEVILIQSSQESYLPSFRHLDNNDPNSCDGFCFTDDYELVSEEKQNYSIHNFAVGVAEDYKTKKTNIMTNLITTFKNITRSEPNKTFVKAGVMNEDLSLTSEGKELFIQFMFDKHAEEFKTDVVDKIIAEQEKK